MSINKEGAVLPVCYELLDGLVESFGGVVQDGFLDRFGINGIAFVSAEGFLLNSVLVQFWLLVDDVGKILLD